MLAVNEMVLHADSDAKKVLMHETITENKNYLINLSQHFPAPRRARVHPTDVIFVVINTYCRKPDSILCFHPNKSPFPKIVTGTPEGHPDGMSGRNRGNKKSDQKHRNEWRKT